MIGWWAEPTPINLAPGAATITLTPGTPDPVITGSYLLAPHSAELTISGGTPIIGGDYTAQPAAAELAATTGEPGINVSQLITTNAATLELATGTPDVSATDHKTLAPTNANLSATTGTPLLVVHTTLQPQAAQLEITTGTPVADIETIAPPEFVAAAGATSTSVSMPSHQTGDILIMIAVGTAAPPSAPAGWTTIGTASRSLYHSVLAYKIASSGSETSGTWTGANAVLCAVYRSSGAITVGDASGTADSSATMSFPSLTLENTSGASTVVMIGITAANNASFPASTNNGSPRRHFFDSADDGVVYDLVGATAFTGDSATFLGAGSALSSSWSLEITTT